MRKEQKRNLRAMAVLGVFLSCAVILGFVEYLIPFDFVIPGIKLGLPNIMTLLVLRKKGIAYAMPFAAIRAIINNLLFGNAVALVYALAGGVLSVLAMWAIGKVKIFGTCGQSVAGAIGHNIGQLISAAAILATPAMIGYYLPFLMVSAAISGFLIGIAESVAEAHFNRVYRHRF